MRNLRAFLDAPAPGTAREADPDHGFFPSRRTTRRVRQPAAASPSPRPTGGRGSQLPCRGHSLGGETTSAPPRVARARVVSVSPWVSVCRMATAARLKCEEFSPPAADFASRTWSSATTDRPNLLAAGNRARRQPRIPTTPTNSTDPTNAFPTGYKLQATCWKPRFPRLPSSWIRPTPTLESRRSVWRRSCLRRGLGMPT